MSAVGSARLFSPSLSIRAERACAYDCARACSPDAPPKQRVPSRVGDPDGAAALMVFARLGWCYTDDDLAAQSPVSHAVFLLAGRNRHHLPEAQDKG